MIENGDDMYQLCHELFPICRSITGKGFRDSLDILKRYMPDLKIVDIPSGTACFDWNVPLEWNINDAYVIDPDGNKVIDFKKSNLHVVGYSVPVDKVIDLEELQNHLYSLPDQPNAIPYVTSYYKERWGFCVTENQRKELKDGSYRVVVDSALEKGNLTYGELILPGASHEEVFLSSYLCHPSMANNELSGPVVTTFIAKWLIGLNKRKYTYRIIFIPETIGSIAYLSKNLEVMKNNIVAGFNVTCIGDERTYSYLPSRNGNTLADKVIRHVLKHIYPDYVSYSYLDRGSDERQYCSPGVDLPVCSVMRTKYGCYPEYHTSLDDLNLVTANGLFGGFNVLRRAIECLENNPVIRSSVLCEPQLGKRGLYPTLSSKGSGDAVRNMMNLLSYSDGASTVLDVAETINVPVWELYEVVSKLKDENILEYVHG